MNPTRKANPALDVNPQASFRFFARCSPKPGPFSAQYGSIWLSEGLARSRWPLGCFVITQDRLPGLARRYDLVAHLRSRIIELLRQRRWLPPPLLKALVWPPIT